MNPVRLKNALLNDIRFQLRYGFYLLYLVVTLIYLGLLFALPVAWRPVAAVIVVFSDPAALGLFFMGAIVLFEKSERTLESVFISPMTIDEYITAKVLSLSLISTVVGLVLLAVAIPGSLQLLPVITGLLTGSVLFSLAGLLVASRVSSLNQFMFGVIPLSTFIALPALLHLFGVGRGWTFWHPGASLIHLLTLGVSPEWIGLGDMMLPLLVMLVWTGLFWKLTTLQVGIMVTRLGGVQL
jgi:fluoroquinolone transport system permease protein